MTTGARAFPAPRPRRPASTHMLVRISHWLKHSAPARPDAERHIDLTGASPIFLNTLQSIRRPATSITFADGRKYWICAHLPWLHHYGNRVPGELGSTTTTAVWAPYMLAFALRFHWLCAYLFMLNGVVYLAGLCIGGGLALHCCPRLSDGSWPFCQMTRYYPEPTIRHTGSAACRSIPQLLDKIQPPPAVRLFFSVAVAGFPGLSPLDGTIHKPAQTLPWLTAIFGRI